MQARECQDHAWIQSERFRGSSTRSDRSGKAATIARLNYLHRLPELAGVRRRSRRCWLGCVPGNLDWRLQLSDGRGCRACCCDSPCLHDLGRRGAVRGLRRGDLRCVRRKTAPQRVALRRTARRPLSLRLFHGIDAIGTGNQSGGQAQ
ncbi:UNVERIFIED_CONTAM: hypothetical protein GTU68_003589 [Idotea baltica]|nr:hypothetical protein [Idotea baltica]